MLVSVLDPPWAPGKPTVKDVAKTSCFLMWTKPEHDGGAKIDSYVIEMLKSGTTDWIRVAENIVGLEYFLKGLMEKQEYSFRVRAVNVAGESEPSEPSDPVLCKERLSKRKLLGTQTGCDVRRHTGTFFGLICSLNVFTKTKAFPLTNSRDLKKARK